MILNKLITLTRDYEDPKYPLLGPNLKGLYTFGLLQNDRKCIMYFFRIIHLCSLFFVISQIIDLYHMRKDFNKALMNLSVTALSVVSICKTISCLILQSRLRKLIRAVSQEEICALKLQNDFEVKLMKIYTNYVRIVTNLFWIVVLTTNIVTILSPFLKYATTSSYRDKLKNGTEQYPQILSSWFPFDNSRMPGYLLATLVHIIMIIQGAGVIAVYDANAIAIMTFLKGHFIILREKCRHIFGEEEKIPFKKEVLARIKECHRHHNFLLEQYASFNSIISPVMFIYVLVCSITICCSVAQLSLDEVPTSQKLWVLEYALALAIQLLFYCWHSNEIAVESERVDRGVYDSNWWKADLQERKLLILLAGKLARPLIMNAGPFTALSVPTFIDIMKGAYSFYTLFTQMQEKRQING